MVRRFLVPCLVPLSSRVWAAAVPEGGRRDQVAAGAKIEAKRGHPAYDVTTCESELSQVVTSPPPVVGLLSSLYGARC
jgi:hypothetical protein